MSRCNSEAQRTKMGACISKRLLSTSRRAPLPSSSSIRQAGMARQRSRCLPTSRSCPCPPKCPVGQGSHVTEMCCPHRSAPGSMPFRKPVVSLRRSGKKIHGVPTQPTPQAVRQAIIERLLPSSPRQCPSCGCSIPPLKITFYQSSANGRCAHCRSMRANAASVSLLPASISRRANAGEKLSNASGPASLLSGAIVTILGHGDSSG